MRCKLTISYNGAQFMGSQQQSNTKNTVLGCFGDALHSLKISSKIIASGRTDRGVHATGQVLHVDLPPFWDNLEKLKQSLSYQLPASIHVKKIEAVNEAFHARYSAKKRVYRYILCEGESNPFENEFITFVQKLDFNKITHAIKLFEGTHNFEMFKKNGSEVTNYERTIYRASAYRHKKYTILHFEANGYLRSQIRMMVSFLIHISDGKLNQNDLLEQITCKKRHLTRLAPHNGLYLAKIKY
ncbi:MAG: tRNA pseudouridine(38-40) synthase TruA [Campylobacterota bacterium]|nr:tRNA pseudouridine(38-40) synthase TruA [Campylobacterota bacterium]